MRRLARTTAALAALALLAAGGGSSSASTPHGRSSGTAAAARFKACLVTDTGGIDDRSFNQLSWQGMRGAAATRPRKIKVTFLESTSTADYARNIDAFIAQKCGIIVTVGFLTASATEAAAKAHPKRKFAIVDCSYRSGCLFGTKVRNIDQLVFSTVQDGFLGGYLAAGMSKTGVVATYGGENFGTVTIYMDGFWDGVRYYNSRHHTHVRVLGWNEKTQKGVFLGSFTDISAGRRIANTFINEGADVIFPVAGGAGLGTAEAIKTANASGKSVSIEWADTDGCLTAAMYCKYFLTSVTKGIAEAVKTVVLAAARGSFRRAYIGTLANGGVALAPYHDFAGKIPAVLKAEITKVRSQIESGKIVPATKSPV
ncbi:MAG TPA: BMP family ABC transporter substrate-binding protein [Streptosporangiaceae bacterium]|nr:BMP family ABC transporter substrate-binding protein [Streptosporangiaceae bacterium]